MLDICFYAITALLTIYGVYLGITGILAFKKLRSPMYKKHSPKNRFAIIIPARNEEFVIKHLLDSIKNQDYPNELYETFVIPNNCTDNTKEVAIQSGAKVLNCKKTIKNKGDVLRVAFQKLRKNKNIDAYIIFDADNIVHHEFLQKMNDVLCEGYEVAQGNRDSKNPHDNWISSSFSIYFWIQNFFYNRSRMFMKGSATISGTGFMVKKSVIDEDGFDTSSLTEDLEFTIQCALNGRDIAYVEDAITFDEQTSNFWHSIHQRSRWTSGSYQCLKKCGVDLVKQLFLKRKIVFFDLLIRFIAPFVQILTLPLSILGIYKTMQLINFDTLGASVLIALGSTLMSTIPTWLINIFISAYYKQLKPSKIMHGIILFPIFMLTWLPINIKCIFAEESTWKEIKHSRNIDIQELINKKRRVLSK